MKQSKSSDNVEYEDYTPKEIEALDKYQEFTGNKFSDEELYEIIIKYDYNDILIKKDLKEMMGSDEYVFHEVGKKKSQKEVSKKPNLKSLKQKDEEADQNYQYDNQDQGNTQAYQYHKRGNRQNNYYYNNRDYYYQKNTGRYNRGGRYRKNNNYGNTQTYIKEMDQPENNELQNENKEEQNTENQQNIKPENEPEHQNEPENNQQVPITEKKEEPEPEPEPEEPENKTEENETEKKKEPEEFKEDIDHHMTKSSKAATNLEPETKKISNNDAEEDQIFKNKNEPEPEPNDYVKEKKPIELVMNKEEIQITPQKKKEFSISKIEISIDKTVKPNKGQNQIEQTYQQNYIGTNNANSQQQKMPMQPMGYPMMVMMPNNMQIDPKNMNNMNMMMNGNPMNCFMMPVYPMNPAMDQTNQGKNMYNPNMNMDQNMNFQGHPGMKNDPNMQAPMYSNFFVPMMNNNPMGGYGQKNMYGSQ